MKPLDASKKKQFSDGLEFYGFQNVFEQFLHLLEKHYSSLENCNKVLQAIEFTYENI